MHTPTTYKTPTAILTVSQVYLFHTNPTEVIMVEQVARSIKETARRTGLSRSSIYRAMTTGALTTVKIGGRRLVRAEDEAAFLNPHRTPSSAA